MWLSTCSFFVIILRCTDHIYEIAIHDVTSEGCTRAEEQYKIKTTKNFQRWKHCDLLIWAQALVLWSPGFSLLLLYRLCHPKLFDVSADFHLGSDWLDLGVPGLLKPIPASVTCWVSVLPSAERADSDASKHLSTWIANVEVLCRVWGALLSTNRGKAGKLDVPEASLFLLILLYLIVTSDYIS